MTNYDGSTGTSGTLRMIINQSGSNFDCTFQIINTSGSTFVNGLAWSANVGGVIVDGTVNISGSGTYTVFSTSIQQFGNVPFQMWIGASGTQGLGGPSTVGPVNLNGGSSSSIPGTVPSFAAPTNQRTPSSLGFTWGAAAANGSAIQNYQIQIATDTAFNNQVTAPQFAASARSANISNGITQNTAYSARIRARNGVGWGPWTAGIRISTSPAAPSPMSVTAQSPQTASLAWVPRGGTGGPSTAQYQLSTVPQSGDADFTGGTGTIITRSVGGTNPDQVLADGLVPGQQYWGHVRMRNGQNLWGDWTPVITFTQPLPTPPTLVVTPALDGRSASLAATPPAGITVTGYNAQYRLLGASTSTDVPFTTSPRVVTNLTPGQAYQWRLLANFSGGSSPYSDWQTIVQPSTNTNPGDYFDGATPAKPDTTYAWDGTADASTSRASAFPPMGWRTFAQGATTSGATGVTVRVTGGIASAHAARTSFWGDTAAAGFHGGTGFAAGETFDVQVGGTYQGSIYVSPSRAQRMAAEITWLDSARAVIGYSPGTAQIVETDDENLTRLTARGLAPTGAVYGAVGWTDVAGDGWSVWQGGDSVLADAAMVSVGALYPYFDGDTPDTPQFEYAWLAAANASASERTTLDYTPPDPLLDPDCPPIPAPPSPPVIDDTCIIPTGEWRRYWAIVGAESISEWLDLVPTLTLTTGGEPARQVRIRYWANPDNILPDDFQQTTGWDAEQIISFMPSATSLTIDGVSERVWASVDGGNTLAADKLLYGTGGTPATWPVLSCGIGYLISLDVPLDTDPGNLTVDVALTRRM